MFKATGWTLEEFISFTEDKQVRDNTRIHIFDGESYIPSLRVYISGLTIKIYPAKYMYQEGLTVREFINECNDKENMDLKLKTMFSKITFIETANNLVMLK